VTAGAPGFAVGLGLTNDCNLACAHCYRDTERVDRLSLADVRRVCDSLPIRAVNLGTGENALHPEFRAILHELHARGLVVTLTSNGYSTSVLDDEELRWLRDVEFSLDFATEPEQDAWRGAGNWRLVLGETERARRLGVAVTIVAVMMRTNYDGLPAIARVAAAHGAAFRVNVYQAVKTDAFSLTYDQFWTGFPAPRGVSARCLLGAPRARGARPRCARRGLRVRDRSRHAAGRGAALRLLAEAVAHARRPRAARPHRRPLGCIRRARHAPRRLPGLHPRRRLPRGLREPKAPARRARAPRRVLSLREREAAARLARPPGKCARLPEGRKRVHERVHQRRLIVR